MYIKDLDIKNFRLFDSDKGIQISDIKKPDGTNKGSGLTMIVGDNALGKSSILDAIVLCLLEYKADQYGISDLNSLDGKTQISITSHEVFSVRGSFPNTDFDAVGYDFYGGVRKRGSSFLNSATTSDQLYRSSDPAKPKTGSPDLRVSVNNPFSGKRYTGTNVLYLDKNRLFQTRSGTYNTTKFDRLMEDFNFQLSQSAPTIDLDQKMRDEVQSHVESDALKTTVAKFEEIAGFKPTLNYIDNIKPFSQSFFAEKQSVDKQINLSKFGSGYEMLFSLTYAYYLSKDSGEKMIIMIDEPELHMHPKLQSSFVELLMEISKDAQCIVVSHSPLLVKQIMQNEHADVLCLRREVDEIKVSETLEHKLPYTSSNEVNYIAFGLATEEYHNELYEHLLINNASSTQIKPFDNDFFHTQKGETLDSPWHGNPNQVTRHTHIRNQIHHRGSLGSPNYDELLESIEKMRDLC